MALKAVASVFETPSRCLAECDRRDYHELIVTKCNHVFCEACLKGWLKSKQVCPIDRTALLSMGTDEGLKEYTPFKEYLEKFTYYIQNDFSTLKEKLTTEKLLSISQCRVLKDAKTKSEKKDQDDFEDHCSICHEVPYQMYFIIEDKNPSKIGRHMHEDCWQANVDDDSTLLDIYVYDLVKVSRNLPWPPKQPDPQPTKPTSKIIIFLLAILLPMSYWAWATNKSTYHKQSAILFVLSIPFLVIIQILSLLLYGIQAVYKDKHA